MAKVKDSASVSDRAEVETVDLRTAATAAADAGLDLPLSHLGEVREKFIAAGLSAGLTRQQIDALLGQSPNHPCPRCGRETRQHKAADSCANPACPHEPKLRICTYAPCRKISEW